MGNGTRLLFNPFVLDTPNQSLLGGTEKIVLRPKTFAVPGFLIRNPHRLVTKSEIRRPQYLIPGSMSLTGLRCQSNVVECQDNNNFSKH
jgi:hypothetical protein